MQFSRRPRDGSNSAGHNRLDRTTEGWLNLLDPTAGRACLVAVRTYPTGLEKVVGFIVLNINQQPVAEIQDICVIRSALQDDIYLQLMTAALERIRNAAHVTWVTVIHHSSDEVAHRRYDHFGFTCVPVSNLSSEGLNHYPADTPIYGGGDAVELQLRIRQTPTTSSSSSSEDKTGKRSRAKDSSASDASYSTSGSKKRRYESPKDSETEYEFDMCIDDVSYFYGLPYCGRPVPFNSFILLFSAAGNPGLYTTLPPQVGLTIEKIRYTCEKETISTPPQPQTRLSSISATSSNAEFKCTVFQKYEIESCQTLRTPTMKSVHFKVLCMSRAHSRRESFTFLRFASIRPPRRPESYGARMWRDVLSSTSGLRQISSQGKTRITQPSYACRGSSHCYPTHAVCHSRQAVDGNTTSDGLSIPASKGVPKVLHF